MISNAVVVAITLILSVYFFRHYTAKKHRASFALSIGFVFFSIINVFDFTLLVYGEITRMMIIIWLMITVLAMVFLYYGTSSLFLSEGSFFRGKMAIFMLVIYLVFFIYVFIITPLEGLMSWLEAPTQLGLMMPIFFAIAVLFYNFTRKIDAGDPSRRGLFIVSIAWFLLTFYSMYRGLFWGEYPPFDSIIQILQMVAWILILYEITIEKAAALTREEELQEEKPQVLICPQCKNRIQKDWDTCPYCKVKLK